MNPSRGPMITPATLHDLPYIVHLSKINAESLGFLTRDAMAGYIARDRVTIAHENADPCGYFLTSRRDRADVRVFQACVQHDARGLRHGLDLLADLITEAALNGSSQISLHCRDGLESNRFWNACGFHLSSIIPGGHTRRRVVNIWTLPVQEALSLPNHPYSARFLAAVLDAQTPTLPRATRTTGSGTPPTAATPRRLFSIADNGDLPAPIEPHRIAALIHHAHGHALAH